MSNANNYGDVLRWLSYFTNMYLVKIIQVENDVVLEFSCNIKKNQEKARKRIRITGPFRICNSKRVIAGGRDLIVDTIIPKKKGRYFSMFEFRIFMNKWLFHDAKVLRVCANVKGEICISFETFEIQILPASCIGDNSFIILEEARNEDR